MTKHWENTHLENLFSLVIGGDWGKDLDFSDSDFVEVYCIRGSEIRDWTKDKGKTAVLRKIAKSSLAKRKLQEGDILVEISGGGPDQPVGRTVLIDKDVLEFEPDVPKVCTNFLRLVRLTDSVDKTFVNYFLTYFYYSGEVVNYQGGSNNLRNLKFSEYSTINIPLPPLPEQKRIVAKLDLLFGQLDHIRKRYESIEEITTKFVSSCLDNSYDSRSTLHDFLEEGTERVGKNWKGKPKVGVSAKEGIIDLDIGSKTTFENYKIVRPGDFVYNAMRVNIGSIAIYDGNDIAITSPDYIVFRIRRALSPRLLLHYLKSEGGLKEIGSNTKGSVRSRLYFSSLVNINYPIAPEPTQAIAENFLTWKSDFKISWETSLKNKLKQLEQAILTKAFQGDLVDQVPSDESAKMLLQKIINQKRNKPEVLLREKVRISESIGFILNKVVMEIVDVIKNSKKKLTPKEVWQKSNFAGDIDAFYATLKDEVEVKKRIKESADKKYLELVK